jgi:signal peptidase II
LLPAFAYLAYLWIREKNTNQSIGLTLLIAGGAGNIIDRLIWGGVIDFIYYPVLEMRGNVADIYLALAVMVIFYEAVKSTYESKKHE